MGICRLDPLPIEDIDLEWQHLEHIRTKLLDYGYNTVYQEYDAVSGFTSTTSQIAEEINGGVGFINYSGHGTDTAWQSHMPRFSNSVVDRLENDNQLPFIFSAACLCGSFDSPDGDCFAEAWMHASNGSNGAPTGAVGAFMASIFQPWEPPLYALDEFPPSSWRATATTSNTRWAEWPSTVSCAC